MHGLNKARSHGKTPRSWPSQLTVLSVIRAATSSSLRNPVCSLGPRGKMWPCRQRTILQRPGKPEDTMRWTLSMLYPDSLVSPNSTPPHPFQCASASNACTWDSSLEMKRWTLLQATGMAMEGIRKPNHFTLSPQVGTTLGKHLRPQSSLQDQVETTVYLPLPEITPLPGWLFLLFFTGSSCSLLFLLFFLSFLRWMHNSLIFLLFSVITFKCMKFPLSALLM